MDENKVQFNLKNAHYALILDGDTDMPTYAAPVRIPGAVSLSLDPDGDVSPFYADGIKYYQSAANNGYSGDLEVARFPDQMLKEVWGVQEVEEDGVLVENSNVEPKSFALLYQIDGDKNNDFYCMYNCTGTRPPISSETNTESKEPKTRSSTISAAPLENGNVLARTTAKTTKAVRDGWFKKVYEIPAEADTSQETTDGQTETE